MTPPTKIGVWMDPQRKQDLIYESHQHEVPEDEVGKIIVERVVTLLNGGGKHRLEALTPWVDEELARRYNEGRRWKTPFANAAVERVSREVLDELRSGKIRRKP